MEQLKNQIPPTLRVLGLLVSEAGVVIRAFGYSSSEETSKDLGGKIHQSELLPMVMACLAFGEDIRNRPVMFHIDNTAAQSALINAGSSNEYSSSIVYIPIWNSNSTCNLDRGLQELAPSQI